MQNEGTQQLKTYVRSEIARLKALQDFDAALGVLSTIEEKTAAAEQTLANLVKQVAEAGDKVANAESDAAEKIKRIEEAAQERIEKITKSANRKLAAHEADTAEAMAEADRKLAGVLSKIDIKQTQLQELADKESGLATTIASLETKKAELEAWIAKIKAV